MNITQVSRELHVSQPAISQEIRLLEKNLGMKLIRKKRRGIELTEAGVSLQIETENFLAKLDALRKKYGRGVSTMIFTLAADDSVTTWLLW